MTEKLKTAVESAWETRDRVSSDDAQLRDQVETVIEMLDKGHARVAEPGEGGWRVNQWLKKAVLLYFRLHDNDIVKCGALTGWDKVPLKYTSYSANDFTEQGARVVPPATVRRGSFVAPGAVLMPSYVNIGAYVGAGSMVDTWATVGSCAQIGANVHLSGGVGIGGVLEPLQANPTIIEDDCFVGARSEIVEGVIVERGAVISMGVFIGQSTRSTIAKAARSAMAACRQAPWSSPARFRRTAAATSSTALSSSNAWMPEPAKRSASMPCCGISEPNRSKQSDRARNRARFTSR